MLTVFLKSNVVQRRMLTTYNLLFYFSVAISILPCYFVQLCQRF